MNILKVENHVKISIIVLCKQVLNRFKMVIPVKILSALQPCFGHLKEEIYAKVSFIVL